MKRLVVVIIIAVAGLVAYNYFTTGELKLVPSASLTQDEKEVKHLEDQFLEA
jgi:predicted negative regulator of RcsB-dependent stress response